MDERRSKPHEQGPSGDDSTPATQEGSSERVAEHDGASWSSESDALIERCKARLIRYGTASEIVRKMEKLELENTATRASVRQYAAGTETVSAFDDFSEQMREHRDELDDLRHLAEAAEAFLRQHGLRFMPSDGSFVVPTPGKKPRSLFRVDVERVLQQLGVSTRPPGDRPNRRELRDEVAAHLASKYPPSELDTKYKGKLAQTITNIWNANTTDG